MFCVFCQKEVNYTLSNIWEKHMVKLHGYTSQMYYDKINNTSAKCPKCGSTRNYLSFSRGYRCFCGDSIECKLCNIKLKAPFCLGKHLVQKHNSVMSLQTYYDTFLKKTDEGHCIVCGNITNLKNIISGYHKHCSLKCVQESKTVRIKKKNTSIKNWGVPFPSQSLEVAKRQYVGRGFSEEEFEFIKDNLTDFELYSRKVRQYSSRFKSKLFKLHDRCQYTNTLFSNTVKRSLDHCMSVFYGFMNNIPIHIIGGIKNLKVVRFDLNISKNKLSLLDENLLTRISATELLTTEEKKHFIDVIQKHKVEDFI